MTSIGRWVALGWPLAALACLTALTAGLLWLARAMTRLKAAEGAQWLEITPPATPTSAAGLWRMLDGCLRLAPGARPWAARPVLAAEWWADPAGLRAGVWVPAAVRPERVAEAIGRAWPNAEVRATHPPMWHRYPTRLLELAPTGGPWAPLINPTRTTPAPGKPGGVDQASDEPLRAVLGALADLAPGEQATAQLIVSAHPHPLSRAGGGVSGALRTVAPALLGSLAGAVAAVAVMLLDLLTDTPTTRRATTSRGGRSAPATSSDPVVNAARAAEATKRASGPHLRATLRIAVSVPMPHDWRHDRARAVDIAAGYQLITHALRPRWRRRWVPERIILRSHSRRHAWVATLPELAALWHPPAEPALYRLAARATQRLEPPEAADQLPNLPQQRPTPQRAKRRRGDRRGDHTADHTALRQPPTPPSRPGPRPDTPPAPDGRAERRTGRRAPVGGSAAAHPPARPPRLAPPPAGTRASTQVSARASHWARPGRGREGGENR